MDANWFPKWLLVFGFLAAVSGVPAAVISSRLNYQARLTDPDGIPLEGSHTFFFSVYDSTSLGTPGEGTLVYSESKSIDVVDGVVSHTVGLGTPLSGSLNLDKMTAARFPLLQVAVDTQGNVILPRTQIVSVPHAMVSDASQSTVAYLPPASAGSLSKGDVVTVSGSGFIQKGYAADETSATSGAPVTFNSGSTGFIAAAPLSATKIVIAYRDSAASNSGKAVVGTVSGNTLTFGSEAEFNAGNTLDITISPLSPSTFAVGFRDFSTSQSGRAVVGSVSGSVITFGPQAVFHTANVGDPAVAGLSASSLVVAYSDASTVPLTGFARIGGVSGTTITFGGPFVFEPGTSGNIGVSPFSSTKFIITYSQGGSLGAGFAEICTSVGTSITTNPAVQFAAVVGERTVPVVMDASNVAIAYLDTNDTAKVVRGSVAGNNLTFGGETAILSSASNLTAAKLSADELVCGATDSLSDGRLVTIKLDGSSIVVSLPTELAASGSSITGGIAPLTASTFVVAYSNPNGVALLNTLRASTPRIVGVVRDSSTNPFFTAVYVDGIVPGVGGVTPGQLYYAAPDGSLSTDSSLPPVGLGVSGGTLLLRIP